MQYEAGGRLLKQFLRVGRSHLGGLTLLCMLPFLYLPHRLDMKDVVVVPPV